MIKVIALDLDNTLLNSQKQLSPHNAAALACAAECGAEIVPATGRFFDAMPECVRTLPFLHYAITINGAQVFDICRNRVVARSEIPLTLALEIMAELDQLPVIYDCYQENGAYMTASMQNRAPEFIPDPAFLRMVQELRKPVPELKGYLRTQGDDVQKIQLFTPDPALRDHLLDELPLRFPQAAISSSVSCNVEINAADANKGAALQTLAEYLGADMSQTLAFGDGLNDVSMLRKAGLGVAMANACPQAQTSADRVTASCDEDGVAQVLEELFPKM